MIRMWDKFCSFAIIVLIGVEKVVSMCIRWFYMQNTHNANYITGQMMMNRFSRFNSTKTVSIIPIAWNVFQFLSVMTSIPFPVFYGSVVSLPVSQSASTVHNFNWPRRVWWCAACAYCACIPIQSSASVAKYLMWLIAETLKYYSIISLKIAKVDIKWNSLVRLFIIHRWFDSQFITFHSKRQQIADE